jgi:hypothetical protein
MGIEKPLPLEERDHAAADPFGERGQVCGGERSGRQLASAGGFAFAPPAENIRRPAGAVRARKEDAVGDGRVQMGEPVARRISYGPHLIRARVCLVFLSCALCHQVP